MSFQRNFSRLRLRDDEAVFPVTLQAAIATANSQAMSNGPEVRENRLEERGLEELYTGGTAGACFVTDRALDNFHMSIPPLLESFIKVRHELKQNGQVAPGLVERKQLVLHLR